MNLPFQRSYWAVPGQLLAGCYPGSLDPAQMDEKLSGLVQAGVTMVVNLMEEMETDHFGNTFHDYSPRLATLAGEAERTIIVRRFSIRDQSIPTPQLMQEILQSIEEEIAAGGVVYVHCWGGKGRTATAVGCYFISQGLETPETVLSKLQTLTAHASDSFWPTPQTAEQCAFIKNWRSGTSTHSIKWSVTANGNHSAT